MKPGRGLSILLLAGALALRLAAGVALATSAQETSNGKQNSTKETSTNTDTTKGANTNTDASSKKQQDITVQSRATAINNFVDVTGDGPTPGDIYVFTDDLFDSQDTSKKVGQADGRCNLINPAAARFECTVVSSFENGTITTDGILVNQQGTTSVASVTGGTGSYRGVSGEASLELGPPQGPHTATFKLLYP